MKNLVLIGFMGSGKTAMGRFLSQELNYDFIDTDQEIEKVTGLKLNQLLKKYGEIRFCSEEHLIIQRIVDQERLIIATGGNFIHQEENVKLLKKNGIFVFLKADIDTIVSRLSRRRTKPFSEKGNINELATKYYQEKLPLYEKYADITVDTSSLSMEETAKTIIAAMREMEKKEPTC